MLRHCAQCVVTAVALLLPCLLLNVLLSVPATTPSALGATIPVLTPTPTEISTPVPTEVVSSSLRLPALYNLPAPRKLGSFLPPEPPVPAPESSDLGTLGGLYSAAYDVNNRGQVVGYGGVTADDKYNEGHAFIWQNGKMRDLGTLGGKHSEALRINESGQVIGNSEYGAGEDKHAFFWARGRMTDIRTLGGTWSRAVDLNDQGQVVGVSSTAADQTHCFLWAAGVMTDLGTLGGASCDVVDINNHGQIVGGSTPADATSDYPAHAFLWEKGTMTDLTSDLGPDENSYATALNELGQVIGARSWPSFNTYNSVLWSNGTAIDLSFGGQGFSRMDAINDHGQVVGYGKTEGSGCGSGMPYCLYHNALLWDNGVFTDLGIKDGRYGNDPVLLNNHRQIVMDPSPWSETQPYLWQDGVLTQFASPGNATAINDDGLAVGYSGHALLWKIALAATQN